MSFAFINQKNQYLFLKFIKIQMLMSMKKEVIFCFLQKNLLFLCQVLRQKTQILMNKGINYQVKLVCNSYLLGCDVSSYIIPNNITNVSQHNGFLFTINKFFN